jgi:hypothetical protein
MSDLTAKFETFETQVATEHTAIMAAIATINDTLSTIGTNSELALENSAANTKYLLGALAAINPCNCANPPSLVVPPIGTTPIAISSEQCKRIQAFLHTVQEIVTTLDAVSSFSISLDFTLLSNSINEVVTSIESGSDLPVISFPEGVQLVGDTITYVADNLLVGGSLASYFSSVYFDLRSGMSTGGSASAMQGLYNGVIDASGLPSYVKPVMKDAAYRALYSYYFDTGTSPNLTGYDGSLCTPTLPSITACTDFASTRITLSGPSELEYLDLLPTSTLGPTAIAGDYFGYTFDCLTNSAGHLVALYIWNTSDSVSLFNSQESGDPSVLLTTHTHAIAVQTLENNDNAHPFTYRICPPS